MPKKIVGNTVIIVLILLNVTFWFLSLDDLGRLEYIFKQFLSELLSSSTLILWSCTFVLATRWKKLEPYFGGLDHMYVTHKYCAMSGFFLIILHILLIPKTESVSPAIILGRISFDGFLILILLTFLAKKIKMKYHIWNISHKFMGVFYLIGIIHYQKAQPLINDYPLPKYFLLLFSLIGIIAWLYKELFYTGIHKLSYSVTAIKYLGEITEFHLKAEGKKLCYKPGQFTFVNFPQTKGLKEYHPFTISNYSDDNSLRFSVKNDGDFTRQLKEELQQEMPSSVIGAYGMFDFQASDSDQIWIAGGIGITPYLSWLQSHDSSFKHKISLFYCTKDEKEAVYAEEIAALQQKFTNISFYLHRSQSDGHITAEIIKGKVRELKGKNIFICGPLPLRLSLVKQFRKAGIKNSQIHFEQFSFK